MTSGVTQGVDRRRMVMLLSTGVILSRCHGAVAEEGDSVSAWSRTGEARMRLVDAGPAWATGGRLAGIEIALDPDILTYWRTPGEAGVPPVVDFAGSSNLAGATLLFPAPERFDEGGSEAFGYKIGVVFPILVQPADPAKPVDFAVSLSFAVCGKFCVPVQGKAALRLQSDGMAPAADGVRSALERVPVRQAVASAGPLGIESIVPAPDGNSVVAVARSSGDATPALFPEAPDPWFLHADAGTPAGAGLTRFTLGILARPPGTGTAALPLQLTLVSGSAAVEVTADLDVALPKP